ncbi:MAG: hypothetical protein QOI21_2919 [Actinomycetota bacterium]|jgi:fatty-acyl-CoA synthase|nr:hypothetical protein [Actinomycetota bacterium]
MYPDPIAAARPDALAYVMAESGDRLTYRELDERSNQLAQLLRSRGIGPGGTLLIIAENRIEWPVVVAAGMRAGLYVTPVNWHLTDRELAGMLDESLSGGAAAAVVTSAGRAEAVSAALGERAVMGLCLDGDRGRFESFHEAIATQPVSPIPDELLGARVLYSGGTTGRPKAFRQELLGVHPRQAPPRHSGLTAKLGIDGGTTFLSPAPNYHAAPFTFQLITLGLGGTVICLERFDPAAALCAIQRYRVSHSQWVPTMLLRLLRLPEAERHIYDLSSHRVAFTSGAPCAPELKQSIMDWWGPILHEYYGASEGYGHTYVAPAEALAHPGTVGRPLTGALHVTGEDATEVPTGVVGKVWFETAATGYRNSDDNPARIHPQGWRSVGDLGHLDDEGFLYLVGRESHTIISGGVNIYPTEIENALLAHPAVADAAVFGVPDPEFGEQVKAVVETREPVTDTELIEFCRARLARFKAPKSIDFADRLPRLPTGKLNKNILRDRYLQPARNDS